MTFREIIDKENPSVSGGDMALFVIILTIIFYFLSFVTKFSYVQLITNKFMKTEAEDNLMNSLRKEYKKMLKTRKNVRPPSAYEMEISNTF